MAGAGKRTFIAGEVLTAAQVNDFLMDQAVMRFSGSAARAASITAPTEGMVTYLDDVNQIEFYDGSAWVRLGVDVRTLVTASGQLLVGAGAGSLVPISLGAENTVLTRNSASPYGLGWQAISGGAKASYSQVNTASTNTALQTTLTPGFYRIQLSNTTSYTSAQFRFVDTDGNFYGATITSGAGFFTIPTQVASLNVTTGSFPFNVLVEEIKGITEVLIAQPTITSFDWTTVSGGSFSYTAAPAAASVGAFDTTTGSFSNLGAASAGATSTTNVVNGTAWAPASLSSSATARLVNADVNGIWSVAASTTTPAYPFKRFTANGTYVPPPWSSSVQVLVVAGGGGGGGVDNGYASRSGAGGAGGASIFTVTTPGSVAVTVGAGGNAGTTATSPGSNGSPSAFGTAASVTGGGGGGHCQGAGLGPTRSIGNGQPGGSGGGAGRTGAVNPSFPSGIVGTAGNGIAGQGNNGGIGAFSPIGPRSSAGGGGGKGSTSPGQVGGSGSVIYGVTIAAGGLGAGGFPITGVGPAGTDGTGNGGGGAAAGYASTGTDGGDGTVIVRAL